MPASTFNTPIMKELLQGIRISDETGRRLGVSPAQLELWIHQLADNLDSFTGSEPRKDNALRDTENGYITQAELNVLLDGLAEPATRCA